MVDTNTVENEKWRNTKAGAWGFLFGSLLGSAITLTCLLLINFLGLNKNYKEHVSVAVTSDRNCNDCHLGASFINLFNNEYVKKNDNVITGMMDKAHIKRW